LWPVEAFTPVPEGFRQGGWVIGIGTFGVREDVHDVVARKPDDPRHLVAAIGLVDLGPGGVLLP
jgi:hypothetical protein